MLFNAYKTYPYSADYYGYSIITNPTDPDQTSKVYTSIPTTVRLSVSTSFVGDLVIVTTSKLQNAGRLANLLDRTGKQIYENSVWEIKSTQPIVNPVGFVQGYKYKAKLISGDI